MKLTKLKLADIKKPVVNVRKHTERQMVEYEKSVRKFGQLRPIVVDETHTILAGNGLYEALLRAGKEDADCYVVDHLSEKDKKKLMLADNRIFDLGVDDIDAFEEIVASLDGDFDVPGWDNDVLMAISSIDDGDVNEVILKQDKKETTPHEVPSESNSMALDGIREKMETAKEEPASVRRFVVCPKCGEKIYL